MSTLSTMLHENGLFLTVRAVLEYVHRRIFNYFIGQALKPKGRINIHPSACLRGLVLMRIGENFYTGPNVWLEAVSLPGSQNQTPRIQIGNNVSLNENVHIAAANLVKVGDNVLMASRIFITDHNHGSYSGPGASSPEIAPMLRDIQEGRQVLIEDNVWIGEMVSILPGVTIGRGCVIGSNSVVNSSIPEYSIAVGTPARVVKFYNFATKTWERCR